MKARDLDGVLHRLRAVVRNMGFLGLAPGASAFNCSASAMVALVRSHLKAGMHELFQLPRDRCCTFGCTWPVLRTEMPLAKSI